MYVSAPYGNRSHWIKNKINKKGCQPTSSTLTQMPSDDQRQLDGHPAFLAGQGV